jgi:hypothetical protein
VKCNDLLTAALRIVILGCIARCNTVKDTLEEVALIDLAQVTDHGVAYLAGLKSVHSACIDLGERNGVLYLEI